MAKRRGRKRAGPSESELSKGELRKLNALRKSLGDDIADRAFAEWLDTQGVNGGGAADKNAGTIIEALQPLIENGKLRIPRGGYILRRGHGRVIIERQKQTNRFQQAASYDPMRTERIAA